MMEVKNKKNLFTVTEPTELLKFLIENIQGKSRNNIKSILVRRLVSVDNQIQTQYNFPIKKGQVIKIFSGKPEEKTRYHGVKILFEDEHIIVIEKEAGLLSIATNKERQLTAYFILTEHIRKTHPKNRVYIVHRLDKDASGVMMFAKSIAVQEKLQNDWQKAIVDRRYSVLVEGIVEKEEDTIISWLKESKALIMYSYNWDNGGQKAITHYKLIKHNEEFSLLEVKIDTGRKNQIRVHMQDIKHSIVGDKKYGSTINPIRRMGLHALSLTFNHPITGEQMHFETPIPTSFLNLIHQKK